MLIVLDGINKNLNTKVNMYGYHEFKNLPDWFMEDKDILSHPPQWLNLLKRYNNNYERIYRVNSLLMI